MSRQHNNKLIRTARIANAPEQIFAKVITRYNQIRSNDDDPTRKFRRTFKEAEFIADVELTAKRNLSPRQLFFFVRIHLMGMTPEAMVAAKMIDSAFDYHLEKNRAAELLGKAFRDARPYPLFPLENYFYNEGMNARRNAAAGGNRENQAAQRRAS